MGLTVDQSGGGSTEASTGEAGGTTATGDTPTTGSGPTTVDPDTTNGPTQPPTTEDGTTADPTTATTVMTVPATATETADTGGSTAGEATADPGTSTSEGTGSEPDSTGACMAVVWYADEDGDGYGDPMATEMACEPPDGYVDNGDDCDDTESKRSPGLVEVCDNLDNDCDELVDEYSPMNTMCGGCKIVPDDPDEPTVAYYFCKTPMKSWDGAKALCEMKMAALVADEGDAEHGFLTGEITKIDAMSGGWWTGGWASDLLGYKWLTGAAISGVDGRWDIVQVGSDPNKCVQLLSSGVNNGNKWTVRQCSEARPFICEQAL